MALRTASGDAGSCDVVSMIATVDRCDDDGDRNDAGVDADVGGEDDSAGSDGVCAAGCCVGGWLWTVRTLPCVGG